MAPDRSTLSAWFIHRKSMSPQLRTPQVEGATFHNAGFFTQSLAVGDLVVGRTIHPERHSMRDDSHTAEAYGIQDAFLCIVHLRHMDAGHTWWDGRHLPTSEMFEGSVHLHDQRYNWTSELSDAFDSVHFSFPQALLQQVLMEDRTEARIELAVPSYDTERRDPTLLHLARSLIPALARPQEANRLFADHVVAAAATHVAASYGSVHLVRRRWGRLARWQELRALDYMAANLDQEISIGDLAAICRLSAGHFAHAFQATIGVPPHRFLLSKRVGRAMELLSRTDLPLTEVALRCGFADQSHLTRAFSQAVGVSPGKWRRQQRD